MNKGEKDSDKHLSYWLEASLFYFPEDDMDIY